MRRIAIVPTLLAACIALAGCGSGNWAHDVGGRIAPDTLSLADRCGVFLKAAVPFADLELGARTAQASGISKITARIEATRSDLPPDTPGRDFAAECQYDNATMTAFRLTKGAPTTPGAAP
jgi:hypothetical protein